MPIIKNVILDMGNVLLDYNPEAILNAFFETKEDKNLIEQELFQGPEWEQGDLGQIKNEERFDGVSKRVPVRLHNALWRCIHGWGRYMLPLPGAKEFCGYIKQKGYGIYILSNACNEFYYYFPRHYDLDFFDGVVVSSDVHIIKPDPRIYKHLLTAYDRKPEECLFIDDREDNVRAAADIGMRARIFRNDFDIIREEYQL